MASIGRVSDETAQMTKSERLVRNVTNAVERGVTVELTV